MVEIARSYGLMHPVFEPVARRWPDGAAHRRRISVAGMTPDPADLDPTAVDEMAPALGPAVQAIVGLYVACRLEGERYAECFARLGAPTYAAMLHEALLGAAGGTREPALS